MKINKLINCICAVMCLGLAASCSSSDIPAEVNEILKNIRVPEFRDVDYLVTDFGAVADGQTDCRAAINDAIMTRPQPVKKNCHNRFRRRCFDCIIK